MDGGEFLRRGPVGGGRGFSAGAKARTEQGDEDEPGSEDGRKTQRRHEGRRLVQVRPNGERRCRGQLAAASVTASWPQPAAMSMPRRWRTVLGISNSADKMCWNVLAGAECFGRPA